MTYVLGFLFSLDLSRVVLIRKEKPARQKGHWNGVGGKLEKNETAVSAMCREFWEETGYVTTDNVWTGFGKLRSEGWSIFLFAGAGDVDKVTTTTDEQVAVFHTCDVIAGDFSTGGGAPALGNIRWLAQMALAVLRGEESCRFFEIEERAS